MKMEIKLAKSQTKTNFQTVNVDVPQEAKYYRKIDDGFFFPEGEILFAVIPKYKPKGDSLITTFTLIRVTTDCQQCTDFHISDCKDDYFSKKNITLKKVIYDWITGHKRRYEYTWLRPEVFDIWTKWDRDGFNEITKEDFDINRMKLLNHYKKEN